MTVLVSVPHAVVPWRMPAAQVDRLRQAFPHHEFVHALTPESRAEGLARCEVACTWLLSAEELAGAPHLRWVHTSAVAAGTLCLEALAARGVAVTNTRGVQDTPIAEHVFALLLALGHRLPFAFDRQRARSWAQNEFVGDLAPVPLRGLELAVIGLGAIGSTIARMGRAFGMQVTGVRRRPEEGGPDGIAVRGVDALDAVVAAADAIVLAAPLTAETETLFDAARVGRMKRGAWLVNISRGQLVDEAALVAALSSGALGGAALDVVRQEPLPPDSPLWQAPNLILTPHTAGFRRDHWDDAAAVFADNLRRWDRGEPLRWLVDPARGY